jgi:hypothetical protein
MNCTNATIRGVDYGDVGMYHAHTCTAMAELTPEMGRGLNLTSKNAGCFTLASSAMYWMDHFGGAVLVTDGQRWQGAR